FLYLSYLSSFLTLHSFPTRLSSDLDACPVTKEIIHISGTFQLPVCIIKSYDHFSTEQLPAHVETFYVDKGADIADFEIVRRADKDRKSTRLNFSHVSITYAVLCLKI